MAGIVVKGVEVKLLDRDLMRRFGGLTAIVDPSVAEVLIEKRKAIYVNKVSDEIDKKEELKIEEKEEVKKSIFPTDIIKE